MCIIPKYNYCAAFESCSCPSSNAIHAHSYFILGACYYILLNLFEIFYDTEFCLEMSIPQEWFPFSIGYTLCD